MTTAAVYSSGVNINVYLSEDTLFLVFQSLSERAPFELFNCCRVCRLWRSISSESSLWKELAKRFKIKEVRPSLRKDVLLAAKKTVQDIGKKRPTYTLLNIRQFTFTALQRQLLKSQPGKNSEDLQKIIKEKYEKRNQEKERLKATFDIILQVGNGSKQLKLANKIATILATDCFLDHKARQEYEKFFLKKMNERTLSGPS
jgi:hypothetical protein